MKKSEKIVNLIFKWLYFIVLFFIFIGEIVRIIPNLIFKNLIFKIRIPKIKLPKVVLPKIFFFSVFFQSISLKLRYFLLGVVMTLLIISIYQSYLFVKSLPNPVNIGKVNYPLSTHIYDRNGELLHEIYREQNRTPVKLKDLPPYVYQATIAIEDKDFYKHKGVSLFSGILRATKEIIFNRSIQGGSTITQQLVKSALLTPERSIERKIKEIILALWTERLYSKEQILEMYLNQVAYGGSAYGIEEAAKTYFGKKAVHLTLEEAAFLAGLPQAPSFYSPYVNPQLAMKRKNEVLQAMKEQGYINEKLKLKAQNSKLNIIPPRTVIKAPHFVFYVKSQLESRFGISKVETGGLRVTTTLDLEIQKEGEKILKEELEKIKNLNVSNGAILVTRPATGEILAMIGSVDYFAQPYGAFNVITAFRQPGSAIKPIMYSFALQNKYTAATIIDDSPIVFNIPGSAPYRPVNYDGKFHGKVPLRYALANSYNVPAVRVFATLSLPEFVSFANKMGIVSWKEPSRFGLSLTLGGGEVTMIEMATAFGVLANLGYKVSLSSFLKVEDVSGTVLYKPSSLRIKEVDSGIAYIINDILSDKFARTWAFGQSSFLEIPGYKVAVKTGTTDDKRDNWAIGYSPDFLVAVWVGNNDNSPMNPYLTSGVTGAAPIWNRMMSYLLKNYTGENKWYEKPENVVEKNCYFGRKEYFIKGTENRVSCQGLLFNQTPTPTSSP